MSERFDVFKCDSCKSVVQVMFGGSSSLTCCDTPMIKEDESTQNGAAEKHLPVVEKTEKGIKISVGAAPHANAEGHYIYWIDVIKGNKQVTHFLEHTDATTIELPCMGCKSEDIKVREYCNLHGLWEAKS